MNKHSRSKKINTTINSKKSEYHKLIGESGTEYYLKRVVGRGTFGVVYESFTNDTLSIDYTNDTDSEHEEISEEENNSNFNDNLLIKNSNTLTFNRNKNKFAIKRYFKSFNPTFPKLR